MNLIRRILGQPEQDPNIDNEDTVPAKPDDFPQGNAADSAAVSNNAKAQTDAADADAAENEEGRFTPMIDGVTRPLPQDVTLTQTTNEHINFGQLTDIGMVRTNNQDAVSSLYFTNASAEDRPDFGIFIVADGMGGHQEGEKASAITVRTLTKEIVNQVYLPMLREDTEDEQNEQVPITETLIDVVQAANASVINHVPDGGTTVTSVLIINDMAYIAHVGDSRIYLLNKGKLEQITRDHSLVQRLIELDQLTAEEAVDHPQKNVLYRALGQSESLEVDTLTRRLPPNSKLIICSDGLWNQVEDQEIADIVKKHNNPQEACENLVTLANSRGGVDNVTVILLQIPG